MYKQMEKKSRWLDEGRYYLRRCLHASWYPPVLQSSDASLDVESLESYYVAVCQLARISVVIDVAFYHSLC